VQAQPRFTKRKKKKVRPPIRFLLGRKKVEGSTLRILLEDGSLSESGVSKGRRGNCVPGKKKKMGRKISKSARYVFLKYWILRKRWGEDRNGLPSLILEER